MMKTLFLFLSLAVQCAAISPKDISNWQIPGERVADACAEYAFCLNYRLFQVGIESQMIAYDWSRKADSGHAIVLFQIEGRWYGIDNESDKARAVRGDTELERVRSFDRRAIQVRPINFGDDYERLSKLATGL